MWRCALVGVLVTAAAACGKKADDAAVVAGAPAGTVVELEGVVTANGKVIRAGDTVAADDVVETADNARVSIELAHNHARWTLGPHKRQKPRESMAWSLKPHDGSAQGVDQIATSAGRDGERRAAETDVTTSAAAPPAAAGSAAPAPGGPPPQLETAAPTTPTAPVPRPAAAMPKVAAPAPQHAAKPEPPMVQPPPPPPPPPPADDDARPRTRGGDAKGDKEDRVMLPAPHARQILAADAGMQKCVAPGAKAHVAITCDDAHCTLTTSDAAAACLKARFGKLELPKASYAFELDITGPAR